MSEDAAIYAIRPIDEAQRQLAQRVARHNDAIVEAILRERLAPVEPWRGLHSLRGRLVVLDYLTDRVREYSIDGAPFARFYPPELDSDGRTMTVNQKYEVIT